MYTYTPTLLACASRYKIGSFWKIKVLILDSKRMFRTVKHVVSQVGFLTIIFIGFKISLTLFFSTTMKPIFFFFFLFVFPQFSQYPEKELEKINHKNKIKNISVGKEGTTQQRSGDI
jgi:fatty acid desaturase